MLTLRCHTADTVRGNYWTTEQRYTKIKVFFGNFIEGKDGVQESQHRELYEDVLVNIRDFTDFAFVRLH